MAFFGAKKEGREMPAFTSRAEAFAYMLSEELGRGVASMEAAKSADEFANIFAKNMGLPEKVEAPLQGVDKYLAIIDKVSIYIDQHPKLVEVAVPLATFVAGLFTGKAADNTPSPPVKKENIDFDKID